MKPTEALKYLEDLAFRALDEEGRRIDVSKADLEALKTAAKCKDKNTLEAIMTRTTLRTMNRTGNELSTCGFVRALQAASNHAVCAYAPGLTSSDIWLNCERVTHEYGRSVPKDWDAFIVLLAESHQAIDELFEAMDAADKKREEGLERRLRSRGFEPTPATPEIYRYDKEMAETRRQARSIAHHTLDWWFQEEPFNAYRRKPRQAAAVAAVIVARINSIAANNGATIWTNRELADFAGYKPGSMSTVVFGPYYAVIYGAYELDLFLIDPEKAPKDWVKRMKRAEPGLADHRDDGGWAGRHEPDCSCKECSRLEEVFQAAVDKEFGGRSKVTGGHQRPKKTGLTFEDIIKKC